MIKDFFLFLALGLFFLVLQATWFSGEAIHPFRPDLLFILIIFLGTLNRLALGLILSVLLGMIADILSWGGLGMAMIIYPLFFWIYIIIGSRTEIRSLPFPVIFILISQIVYRFLVHFFLTFSKDLEFSGYQSFLMVEQGIITMVFSIPVLFLFKLFFEKKPSLR